MRITNITATNFKSFKEINVKLDDFTLIVGANAAGKSNLMSIFKFIRDIVNEGLTDAIDMQGGIDYLSNANAEKGTPIEISFAIDVNDTKWWLRVKDDLMVSPTSLFYKFEITPNKRGENYNITYDELNIQYEMAKRVKSEGSKKFSLENLDKRCSTNILKKNQYSRYEIEEKFPDDMSLKDDASIISSHIKFALEDLKADRRQLLLSNLSYFLPPIFSNEQFIAIFDFDPWHLKRPCQINSKKVLEENGSNLASILQSILDSKEKKQKFLSVLKNILPFVKNLKVDRNYDQSYSYKATETYSNKAFYSSFLSDGTVSIIATIVALYFDNRSDIIIIEEPERNIHPKLLAKVVQMAEDVSSKKQIIFTTHNPEILGNADLKNIRFVQRDVEGYSNIILPANSDKVNAFIANELTIGDLFVQNLLGE